MQTHSVFELAMRQWRIVLTLTLVLIAYGVVSFLTMPRQEFPEFTIRQGLVVGVMPGATAREIEERLTKPVESFLFSFNEVNKQKTYSISKGERLFVFVELGDEIQGLEAPAFWAKLRHGLNELKLTLPSGVLALVGNNDFGDTSALLITLEAEGRSPRDLEAYLEVLESHLRRLPATSKLRSHGLQREVIRVSISRERLSRYGVRPALVFGALQGLGAPPVGNRLDGDELELPVRLGQVLRSEHELGETILLSVPTGDHVRLKDVAQIRREYGHDDSFVRYNGRPAVVLSIEMRSGNDITRFGEQVGQAIAAAQRELPAGVVISRIADQPKVVSASVGHFVRDFGIAIAAVILATMLLLPMRVAAVAAISIPVTIAITLGVLNLLKVQLQTVSLAGLVVVLGMVVDNAIVIIDDHITKLDQGLDRWAAAWKSARELLLPVFTATLAIILAYAPLGVILTGMAGDFLGSLPVTVAVALFTSLAVAAFLVPIMNYAFIHRGVRRREGQRRSLLDVIQAGYDLALGAAFRHRLLVLTLGVGSVVAAGFMLAHQPMQSFPRVDRSQFAVEVFLANGSSLKRTARVVERLEKELLADKRVTSVTSFVGDSSPRFHTVYAPNIPARHYAQLIVNTIDDQSVPAILRERERNWRERYPEAWVRWKQLDFQPGFPVDVRLSGADPEALKLAAARVEALARSIPGTTWVHSDWEEPVPSVEVRPDLDAASRLGVMPSMLQLSLALGLQGFPVATLWEGDYPVQVLLQDDSSDGSTLEGLRQQVVTSPLLGASVPLEQLASLAPSWEEGAIVHRNGVQTISVRMDIDRDALASRVQGELERSLPVLGLDPAVKIAYGGEKELSAEINIPMGKSFATSVVLIYLVLLFQFRRHLKALVVMLSMPLALFGAAFGLVVTGYPFGTTSFVGIISLMGIVVRNGIILVGYAEDLRRGQGLSAREAGLAAGRRRMRPIYLTSMAAAIGVVPMVLSRSPLWGPLGAVTCFGLLFAMLLTLFVLPVAYSLMAGSEKRAAPDAGGAKAAAAALLLALVALPGLGRAETLRLSLDEGRRLTLERNAEVQSAELAIEAADETRAAAFTRYFPQVSASVTGFAALDSLMKIKTQGGNLPVYDGNPANLPNATEFAYFPASTISAADSGYILSLTAIQPLFTGGRLYHGNQLAGLGVQAAWEKAALAQRDALAATEEKYLRSLTLAEKLKILDSAESLLEALEKEVHDAATAGLITRNDELRVGLQRRRLAVDRRRLVDGMALASEDLRRHLGLPEGTRLELTDTLAAPEDPAALADQGQGALERRPETRLLELGVEAARLQTALKLGEMLPTLSLGASFMRYDISGLGATNNLLVFGMASIPISGIWEGWHARASQELEQQLAEQRLSDTRKLLGLEVRKRWDDLEAAWLEVELAELGVQQVEENLREAVDRHASGLEAFSKVLEAQVERQQALDGRTDARADCALKRLAYLRAIGRDGAPGAAP